MKERAEDRSKERLLRRHPDGITYLLRSSIYHTNMQRGKFSADSRREVSEGK